MTWPQDLNTTNHFLTALSTNMPVPALSLSLSLRSLIFFHNGAKHPHLTLSSKVKSTVKMEGRDRYINIPAVLWVP